MSTPNIIGSFTYKYTIKGLPNINWHINVLYVHLHICIYHSFKMISTHQLTIAGPRKYKDK